MGVNMASCRAVKNEEREKEREREREIERERERKGREKERERERERLRERERERERDRERERWSAVIESAVPVSLKCSRTVSRISGFSCRHPQFKGLFAAIQTDQTG
jgi:hypothetical protein